MKETEKHTVNGKCKLGHLIIPDLTRLTARSRSVRKEELTTLQILMAEGMKGIHTYNIDVHFKKPLKLGVIGCITRLDLKDRRGVWSKIGLLSRFIPFSFDYDEKLKIDIARAKILRFLIRYMIIHVWQSFGYRVSTSVDRQKDSSNKKPN